MREGSIKGSSADSPFCRELLGTAQHRRHPGPGTIPILTLRTFLFLMSPQCVFPESHWWAWKASLFIVLTVFNKQFYLETSDQGNLKARAGTLTGCNRFKWEASKWSLNVSNGQGSDVMPLRQAKAGWARLSHGGSCALWLKEAAWGRGEEPGLVSQVCGRWTWASYENVWKLNGFHWGKKGRIIMPFHRFSEEIGRCTVY